MKKIICLLCFFTGIFLIENSFVSAALPSGNKLEARETNNFKDRFEENHRIAGGDSNTRFEQSTTESSGSLRGGIGEMPMPVGNSFCIILLIGAAYAACLQMRAKRTNTGVDK